MIEDEQHRWVPNKVRQRFAAGAVAITGYVQFADTAMVEILGLSGYDAVTIDLEHTTYGIRLVQDMIVAAEVVEVVSIVRIQPSARDLASRVLDAGARGVQFTHVRDVEAAREAAASVRYDPLGRRSADALARAQRFGAVPWPEYSRHANDDVLCIVLLEDPTALSNAEAIASVEGVDVVAVGMYDLADSMGIKEGHREELLATVQTVASDVLRAGNARFGFSIGHPTLPLTMEDVKKLGVSFASMMPTGDIELRELLTRRMNELRAEERAFQRGQEGK